MERTKQHLVGCKKHEKIEKVTDSRDDNSVGLLSPVGLGGHPRSSGSAGGAAPFRLLKQLAGSQFADEDAIGGKKVVAG